MEERSDIKWYTNEFEFCLNIDSKCVSSICHTAKDWNVSKKPAGGAETMFSRSCCCCGAALGVVRSLFTIHLQLEVSKAAQINFTA